MRNLFSSFIIASLFVFFSCGQSEKEQPLPDRNTAEEAPEQENRTYLEIDMEQFEGIEAGDEVEFTLENGESYTLNIQRVQETIPGLLSIAANVGDMETGQAAMIYRDEGLRGSIDMYVMDISYQINYDSEMKRYYLTERTGEDILEGGEPLTPPIDGN